MLTLEGLTVGRAGRALVSEISIDLAEGETLVVAGPSGCGKSTLLATIAGLLPPHAGRIVVGGRDVTTLPPHRRGVGLMFQHHALFPNLDVAGNVAFGLRMAGMAAAERTSRVEELLAAVGLGGFGQRSVTELSGGEQQRVALARSLAPAPAVLLLDEPFSSLDRARRDALLSEVRELCADLRQTMIAVTHDHTEALALGDRVAVVADGVVAQCDTPVAVWTRPAHVGVVRSLGLGGLVPLVPTTQGARIVPFLPEVVADDERITHAYAPPGAWGLGDEPPRGALHCRAEVRSVRFAGAGWEVTAALVATEGPNVANTAPGSTAPGSTAPGSTVLTFSVPPGAAPAPGAVTSAWIEPGTLVLLASPGVDDHHR